MARVPVLIMVADPATGNALSGVAATVKNRATVTNVTLYAAETGPTTVTNPLTTDTYGRAQAWADRAAFRIDYAGTGLTSWSEYRDLGPSSDAGVDSAMLAAGVVSNIPYTSLATGATGLLVGAFDASKSATTVLAAGGVQSTVTFGTENFDYSNWYDPTTSRYTPLVAGIYEIKTQVKFPGSTLGFYLYVVMRKNGGTYRQFPGVASANESAILMSAYVAMNGSTDYIDIGASAQAGITIAATVDTFFCGRLIGRT